MDKIQSNILNILKSKDEDITITEIAKKICADRHTAAKHLEVLKSKGLIEMRTIGKSRVWKISKAPIVNAIQDEEGITKSFKDILNNIDNQISIQSSDFNIIWTNNKSKKSKCYESVGNSTKCSNCPIEKTFKTGMPNSGIVNWNTRRVKIISQPIMDARGNVSAVVEIVKEIIK